MALSDEREAASPYPLSWPLGWKREAQDRRSNFGRTGQTLTVYRAYQIVLTELERIGARGNVTISTNMPLNRNGTLAEKRKPLKDVGAAVYFELKDDAGQWQPRVLACDRWWSLEENLYAIAKHIESLRAQERWGVGSVAQAFAGYAALPAAAGGTPWWDVLRISRTCSLAEAEAAFKRQARLHHPDVGGREHDWHELQQAISQARDALR